MIIESVALVLAASVFFVALRARRTEPVEPEYDPYELPFGDL